MLKLILALALAALLPATAWPPVADTRPDLEPYDIVTGCMAEAPPLVTPRAEQPKVGQPVESDDLPADEMGDLIIEDFQDEVHEDPSDKPPIDLGIPAPWEETGDLLPSPRRDSPKPLFLPLRRPDP